MNNYERDPDFTKNKLAGQIKEVAGKISGNEQLELKGKIQSSKADLKKSVKVADRIEDIKENIAASINNKIDKNRKNIKKQK